MMTRWPPLMALCCLCALFGALPALGEVAVTKEGDVYALANDRMRVEVDAVAGGRIKSWTLKPAGSDLIALWEGAGEIGGALDDRAYFTAMRYRPAIMHPGPDTGVLRLEAGHPSGLRVVKILTLAKESPALTVTHEWHNGTQTPRRLFIRNFLLPGNKPQTEDHLYWINGTPERSETLVKASPQAGGYYIPDKPEYAALWDAQSGDGIAAYVPGVDKFYFWRGSKEHPTFEWLYENVPAGKILRATAVLVPVRGEKTAPDWEALIATHASQARPASLVDLPGWVDEATVFEVTQQERSRGFWLSIGEQAGKSRIPDPLPLDLPSASSRHIALTLNTLKALRGAVELTIPEPFRNAVEVFWETLGEDRKELLPVPSEPMALGAGTRQNLWLRVTSAGREPGEYQVPIGIRVGTQSAQVNLQLRVWSATETTHRPFHIRGYCGGFPVWAGGYEVTPEGLRRLEAILKTFADMGGNVLDWNGVWARILANTKIAGTDHLVTQVSAQNPETLDLDNLPRLDFSYYDPWFDLAKRYGVTRLETYMMHPAGGKLSWYLLGPAVGADRAKPGTPEAEKVLVWLYSEMKRYLQQQGFHGFFCKISDEISPEAIPAHIETAKVVRRAGWRPFTTITGMIARTAEHINAMDPSCDQWQLAFGLKDDFLALRDKRFTMVDETYPIQADWGHYTNGGAVETWGLRVLGEGGLVPVDPADVDRFELLEDGRPLKILGGSPWGNKTRGVVITGGSLKQHLYVSAFDGEPPADHRYTLKLRLRRPDPEGEPLIALDPTDEVWCYGGGSSPFRAAYHAGYVYPLICLHHGFEGYGQWAFYHWNKTEKIMWLGEAGEVTVSPVYCGYRDGWHDVLLYSAVIAAEGRETFAQIVGVGEDAALRVAPRSHEVYSFSTVVNADDPLAVNEARRQALAVLSGG